MRRGIFTTLTAVACMSAGLFAPSAGAAEAKPAFRGHLLFYFGFKATQPDATVYRIGADGRGRKTIGIDSYDGVSYSPDGKSAAYVVTTGAMRGDGSYPTSIVVANPDGSVTQVSPGGVDGLDPAWSPDGKSIAYIAGPSDGTGYVHVVRPDGFGDHEIAGTANGNQPSWAPDSRRLVYFTFDGNVKHYTRIYVVNIHTSKPVEIGQRLTQTPANPNLNRQPHWSPDGRFIDFVVSTGVKSDGFAVVAPNGTGGRILDTRPSSTDFGGVWVPGKGIVVDHVTRRGTKILGDDTQLISLTGKVTELFRHSIQSELLGYTSR